MIIIYISSKIVVNMLDNLFEAKLTKQTTNDSLKVKSLLKRYFFINFNMFN